MNPGSEFSGPTGVFAVNGMLELAPYQVKIEAPEYEHQVIPRIVASRSGDEVPEIKLTRIDPKNYQPVSGRVASADGKPMPGVLIRLLATRTPRVKWGVFPMNWRMIKSGQIEQNPACLQFLSTTTDSQGMFRFPQVKRETELDLFYWGGNVASGMLLDIAHKHGNLREIAIPGVPVAKLEIGFDRKTFPDATMISITSEMFGDRTTFLRETDRTFTFDGLSAATYQVTLQGKNVRGKDDSFTASVLATKKVELKAGEMLHIDFKSEDQPAK